MSEVTRVKVNGVSKTFKLPHDRNSSIKSALINFRHNKSYELQEALKSVSFEVKEGEFFGVVGRNGSGKSTLLKVLAGIYQPTEGDINIRGTLVPFIELGVGFNPELTGRENVYLNGALLGLNRKDMNRLYGSIVEFAELEQFMDQKLKNYSSGMQVRLAFSIAIRAQGDILLLDEVLAVGDANFQKKCFDYFQDLKENKKTVILVSHSMDSVVKFCDRALLLEEGKLKMIGDPKDVASLYLLKNAGKSSDKDRDNAKDDKTGIELLGVDVSKASNIYTPNETVTFTINYRLKKKFNHQFGISIMKNGVALHERDTKDTKLSSSPGVHTISWSAPATSLNEGLHYINIAAFTDEGFNLVAYINEANKFIINREESSQGGLMDMKSYWEKAT